MPRRAIGYDKTRAVGITDRGVKCQIAYTMTHRLTWRYSYRREQAHSMPDLSPIQGSTSAYADVILMENKRRRAGHFAAPHTGS